MLNNLARQEIKLEALAHLLRQIKPVQYYRIVVVLVVPFLVNGLLWNSSTAPRIDQWRDLKVVESLLAMKPNLESDLAESRQMIKAWEEKSLIQDDPTAGVREIQKLAGDHQVTIKQIRIVRIPDSGSAKKASLSYEKPQVAIQATGSFLKLTRWMNALEEKAALSIETWAAKPEGETSDSISVDITVGVLLKKT